MKKQKYVEETMKLVSNDSLVVGHISNVQKLSAIRADVEREYEVDKYGIFEVASPNFHTYYPEVKAEDLVPNDDDFIMPVFRALSATVVNKKWNPVDYGANDALKASIPKLIGQTIYANHEAMVGNELGAVSDAYWQESYKTKGGIVVPAGINAVFKIDGKSHPNIVRKLTMKPPAIHSNSVTIQFMWEQSHPKMDRMEFLNKMGTYGEDNQLVRKIMTEVVAYHETSLVAHGADPWAQIKGTDGKIVNPKYADSMARLSAESQEIVKKIYVVSYKSDIAALTADTTIPKIDNNNTNDFMKKELIALMALLAFNVKDENAEVLSFTKDGKDYSLEEAQDAIKQIQSNAAKLGQTEASLETLKQEKTTLEGKVNALTAEVANLKTKEPSAESAALADFRKTVEANYRKLKGDKAQDSYIASLGSMDYAALKVINEEYAEALNEKFPLECQDCHSNNVHRASAVGGTDKPENSGKPKPAAEVFESLSKGYERTMNAQSPLFAADKK